MLREIRTGGPASRRWFRERDLDLMIWFAADGSPSSFELSTVQGDEELLWRWQQDAGVTLWRGRHKASPLLSPEHSDIPSSLISRLVVLGGELPPDILEFVRSVLEGHQRA